MYENLEQIYNHSCKVLSDHEEKVASLDDARELYVALKSIIRIAEEFKNFFESDDYDKKEINQELVNFLDSYSKRQNDLNREIGIIWNNSEAHLVDHSGDESIWYKDLRDYLLYDTPEDIVREWENEE
jgi:hypothetical protein